MDFASGLGANRSDSLWYREDLQRRHEAKDVGFMCMDIGRTTLVGEPHNATDISVWRAFAAALRP